MEVYGKKWNVRNQSFLYTNPISIIHFTAGSNEDLTNLLALAKAGQALKAPCGDGHHLVVRVNQTVAGARQDVGLQLCNGSGIQQESTHTLHFDSASPFTPSAGLTSLVRRNAQPESLQEIQSSLLPPDEHARIGTLIRERI